MNQHPWNGPFWEFLGLHSPKYCSILLEFRPEVVTRKNNTVFEKSFRISNFDSSRTHPEFTVLVYFWTQYTAGKLKIFLKTEISKTTSWGNNVSPRSQKNHRVLVKFYELFKMCHLRHRLSTFYFVEKLRFTLKIFKFLYFQPSPNLLNLWRHDEYPCMRQGVFVNISFEPNSLTNQTWPVDRCKQEQ